MTTSRSALIITTVALILLALLPTVSAGVLLVDERDYWGDFIVEGGATPAMRSNSIYITDITKYNDIKYVYYRGTTYPAHYGILNQYPSYQMPVTLKIGSTVVATGTASYNALYDGAGDPSKCQFWIDFDTFDIKTYTGPQMLSIVPQSDLLFNGVACHGNLGSVPTSAHPICFYQYTSDSNKGELAGYHIYRGESYWENILNIDSKNIGIIRNTANGTFESSLTVVSGINTFADTGTHDISFPYTTSGEWTVINPNGREYSGVLGVPADEPGESPTVRTGSVTMTDHNGTSISGFEVTAVNHYTDEEYTVSTDTDVAVITLPMDRTVEIRNPQTGVYEEAPVGYYRFYGQAPGYKMLNEEGIKVSVMPEKYGSYRLCDILVSSDTGPLTGKHQFQIRSQSDFSVLQTGTISAKSRTTGMWYNTTVVDGLATLILPYDTSDALSEHAGHYYVYATSPGYEDSDYGTQIIVTPQTVSEVRTILLTPIGGVPTPGNVTLRIQALSETGQSVDNAEIFIAGTLGAGKDVWDTYTTSWTGFIEVSVPGNSTYDIVARGAGYYDSSRRIEVFTEDPPIIEMRLYLSGAPTIEPTTEPTGWVTGPPTTQPTGGIPDEDDGSGGFLMQAVRGIGNAFGVGFSTAKIIFGMLLALSIGFATAKQLRGGAAEFGLGLLGGTMLGILVGLIPVWTIVVLLLVVGLYIGNRYVGGGNNG